MNKASIATGVIVAGALILGASSFTQPEVHAMDNDNISNSVDADGISDNLKQAINFYDKSLVVDKNYLSSMTQFEYRGDPTTSLYDLRGLQYATSLVSMNLSKSNTINLSPISNLTNLKELDLSDSTFTRNYQSKDVNVLKNLTGLTTLNLGNGGESDENNIGSISDLSGLKNLTNLQDLNIDNAKETSLNDLSNLSNLTSLSASYNEKLSDISGLKNLTKLQKINLDNDGIVDFSSLSSLKDLQGNDNVILGTQNITLDEKSDNSDSFSFDLSKYISPNAKDIKITKIGMYNGETQTSATVDDHDLSDIKISNIEEQLSDLNISFNENIPINGNYYPVTVNLAMTYRNMNLAPKIIAHDVTLESGAEWNPRDAIEGLYYDGREIPKSQELIDSLMQSGLDIDPSEIDTSKPGSIQVTYSVTGLQTTTITVTIKGPDNGSSGGNSSGNHHSSTNSSNSNHSDISSIQSLMLITRSSGLIPIYNQNGEKISDQTLNRLTKFNVTQKNVVNGETYYEISDGNWIKASDVRDYTKGSGVLQTKSDSNKFILNSNGTRLNRALKKTTSWLYNGSAEFDGTKYYRVATDEWVSANDVVLYNKINGVVKANVQAQVYKDTGEKSNRALAKNSEFVTDKVSKSIDGETMYRVATDEWVKASDVTLK
ncbi:leucine-rich repeat domain-containing protein [Companilactobacillus sp. HBUAS59699]|uniref:leucine-rich repeat domain-containing protein n=1 Tax=Companilactobacillus sp. HBUAS59699 TaxID=3109358 RepID=UPI002FF01F43